MGHIDVSGVEFALSDGRVLLNDVSFRVGDGAKVALIGANGSGKTTLLKTISGLLNPSNGSIKFHINNCHYYFKRNDTKYCLSKNYWSCGFHQ